MNIVEDFFRKPKRVDEMEFIPLAGLELTPVCPLGICDGSGITTQGFDDDVRDVVCVCSLDEGGHDE